MITIIIINKYLFIYVFLLHLTGITPLILASDMNHPQVVRILLEGGAEVDQQNVAGKWL